VEGHGVRDEEELRKNESATAKEEKKEELTNMLEELARNVLINRVVLRQLKRNVEHRKGVEPHPPRPVRLTHRSARRETLGTIEGRDVVETEETTFEDVLAVLVFAVNPPA
jgi:hypothetical protein